MPNRWLGRLALFAIAPLVLWNWWINWNSLQATWWQLVLLLLVSFVAFILWTRISLPPMPQEAFRGQFWRERMRQAWPFLLLFTALTTRIESFGWFQHLEDTFLDTFIRWQSKVIPTGLFVVEITDDDYQNLFDGKSPLKPEPVLELIRVIRHGCPSVIGVDLDTQDKSWADKKLWNKSDAELRAREIIWAEVPQQAPGGGTKPEPTFDFTPVLGGELEKSQQLRMGVVLFPLDVDGRVRRHRSNFDLRQAPSQCKPACPSLYYRVVNEMCSTPSACGLQIPDGWVGRIRRAMRDHFAKMFPPKYEYFNFSGGRYSFQIVQASEFLRKADKEKPVAADPIWFREWQERLEERLRGKVVLIGGTYKEGRDEYMTPLGEMAGVELIANAIESEANGPVFPGDWPPMRVIAVFLDLIMGGVVVYIYHKWERTWVAPAFSLGLALLVPLVLAAISFYWLAISLSVAPVMVGMVIHQMFESARSNLSA
jgi:CHASE2 domain-containing sensor protein